MAVLRKDNISRGAHNMAGDGRVPDGVVGPATRGALTAYLKHRGRDGELVMLTTLNALQGERYVYLCEKRQQNEDFIFGWMLHRVVI